MKQSTRLFVAVVGVIAMLLAALPTFAMRIESGTLPSKTTVTRKTQEVQSEASPAVVTQSTAPQSTASQIEVQAAPVAAASKPVISVYAGPSTPEAAPQVQPAVAPIEALSPVASTATAVIAEQPAVAAMPPAAPDKGGDVEFTGNITSLTGTLPNLTLTIASNTVGTDSGTEIIGTLAVGKLVQVKGTAQSDGSILASRLKIEDAPGNEGEVEFRGSIALLPGTPDFTGGWVVGDFTVTVNVTTTIDQTRGVVAVGAIAEVKATRQPDGSLLATRIKIEDANEFENEAEFKGVISNLGGTAPALTMRVNTITVTTNAQTQISGTLANGVLVEVHGSTQPDGSVLASAIKVEQPEVEPVETEFTAHISGTLPIGLLGAWSFDNGQTVTVDAHTLIDQSRGLVAPGALVEVKAVKQLDSTWLAVRIKVEND